MGSFMIKKTRWLHKILHEATFIDDGALLFLTFIDIVLTVVFFIACSIDVLTMIALIMLGILIPLIKVRAWIKLKIAPALIWCLVTAFAGWSFMLTTISEQSELPPTPKYVTDAQSSLKTLQNQQAEFRNKNQRSNANAMQESIDKTQLVLDTANDKANKETSHIKALSVFGRIPTILTNPTAPLLIATVFYLAIFGGFEWTIYTIATDMGKTKPVQENEPIKRPSKKRKRPAKKPAKLEVSFVENGETKQKIPIPKYPAYEWQD
jgi:hypothetical protein